MDTKRIARVFPRKTNMSPKDPLAFFGMPTLDAMAMDIDEVHISVTFTWDLDAADFTINFEEHDFCSFGERRAE